MTPAARLSAAVEVLADIEARRRPAADALKDWGLGHRFAGPGSGVRQASSDQAAATGVVLFRLRHQPMRPSAPRPDRNSGSAAGRGVTKLNVMVSFGSE